MKLIFLVITTLAFNYFGCIAQSLTIKREEEVFIRDNIVLKCPQRRSGIFQKVWTKDGVLLATDNTIQRQDSRLSVEDSGFTLIIKNANFGDSGVYQCIVKQNQNPQLIYVITVQVIVPDTEELDDRLAVVEEKIKATEFTIHTNDARMQKRIDQLEKEFGDQLSSSANVVSSIKASLEEDISQVWQSNTKLDVKFLNMESRLQKIQKQTEVTKADSQNDMDSMQKQIDALRMTDDRTKLEFEDEITIVTSNVQNLQTEIKDVRDEAQRRFSSLDDRLKGLARHTRDSRMILDEKVATTSLQIEEIERSVNYSTKINQDQLTKIEIRISDLDKAIKSVSENGKSHVTKEEWFTQINVVNHLEDELTSLKARLNDVAIAKEELADILDNLAKMEQTLKLKQDYLNATNEELYSLTGAFEEHQRNLTSVTEQFHNTVNTLTSRNDALQQQINVLEADRQAKLLLPTPLLVDHNVAMMASRNGEMVTIYTWDIQDMQTHFDAAKSHVDPKYYVESPVFYTALPGYHMILRLYPDYKRSGHVGLFAGLRVGEFDDVIPWPFTNKYVLSLRMGETGLAVDEREINPKQSPSCRTKFRRPSAYYDTTCGFQSFVSHDNLIEYATKNQNHFQISVAVYMASL